MRCFIALEVARGVKSQCRILISMLKSLDFHAKWVEEENLHITMFFLGDISNNQIEKTSDMLKEIHVKPFHLFINKLGYFQKFSKPTTIWLGLKKSDSLEQLHSTMKMKLKGIYHRTFGNKFIPHLTLGRLKSFPVDWKEKIETIQVEMVEFGDIVLSLKSSTLTKTGPIYNALETVVI